jgi:HAD superfamily hydrolase (TIGR01509 family)
VFDCDGTLADTEPVADEAWRRVLAEFGYQPTDADFRAIIGRPYPQTFAYFAQRVELGDPDEFRPLVRDRFRRLLEHRLALHPDAEETLRRLAAARVPLAVASSSSRDHVLHILERTGVAALVQAVVGAEDVERHKPHPEPYLLAARHLEVAASACAAVEDTPVGVDSAVAAGMYTVGVLRGGFGASDLAAAHRVVAHLTAEALTPGP